MNICRFARFFPAKEEVFGGNWSGLYNISKAQEELGHNINVITGKRLSKKQKNFEEINKIKVHRVFSFAPSFLNLPYIVYGFNAVRKFKKLKKENKFDLIHTHNEDTFIPMHYIKKKTKLPVFYHCHLLIKAWDEKGLLDIRKKFPGIITDVYSRLYYEKIAINNADMIFAYSEESKKEINDLYCFPEEKIHVILNGTDVNMFKPLKTDLRSRLKIKDNEILLFIPDIGARKGFHEMISVFRKLEKEFKNIKLLVTGGKKQELQERYPSDKIIFEGMVPYNSMPEYYNACDIFVLPTKYEGLPKSILEAMSCEKIVLSTKVNGIPAVIKEGENGFMINSVNEKELYDKLVYILNNIDSLKNIKKNARKTVLNKFTLKHFAERIDEGYKKYFESRKEKI